MSNYLGNGFTRDIERMMGCVLFLLIACIVCAFFLGRCSRGIEFQSPIKTPTPENRQ